MAVVLVVVVVLLVLRGLGKPGEVTAQFLPHDTQIYFTVNLRPGRSQILKALDIKAILERSPVYEDRRDELLDNLEEETGIDFMDDILPWLGKDMTFALLDAFADTPEWIVLLQTTDRDASEDFLRDLTRYLEDAQNAEFDRRTSRGAIIYTAEGEEGSFAVTDNYVLFGSDQGVVRRTIRDLDSPPLRPLSEDDTFLQFQERTPEDRFMLLFINTNDLLRDARRSLDPFDFGFFGFFEAIETNIPEGIVLSGSFIDKGMRLDLYSDTPSDSFVTSGGNSLDIASDLPEDTLFMLSLVGISDGWDQFRDSLWDYDRDSARELDDALDKLEDTTGVDLDRDVIRELIGAIALAVLPSEFRFDQYGSGLESGAVEALLLAELGEPRGLQDLMKKLTNFLEEGADIPVRRENAGKYEMVSLDLRDQGRATRDFSPGFFFSDRMVVVGATEDSLIRASDTIDGNERPLSKNPEFRRLSAMGPKDPSFVMFADIAGIIEMVVDALPRDIQRNYEDEVSPFVKPLNSFFTAAAVNEQTSHYTLILTVRE